MAKLLLQGRTIKVPLFVGGMRIDADTGELSGPPFDQAVNRIATRAAIARSF